MQPYAHSLHEVVAAAHDVLFEKRSRHEEYEYEHQRRRGEPQRAFEQQSEIGAEDRSGFFEVTFGIFFLYPRLRHAGDDDLCRFLRLGDHVGVDEELSEQETRLSRGLARRL